ncbi:MAG: D-alanine--D-alanine ligase [Patescibacteria group bacterium]|jgi:D-alanine-D-alanine ligase|nr:D-alanine--D-alanine ligase [Patescibacteria group bacterium]
MKTVAVFFGGQSTEHDVSIVTALSSIIKPLELTNKYLVIPVYIARDGRWYFDDKLKKIETYQTNDIVNIIELQKPIRIQLGSGLKIIKPTRIGKRDYEIDIDIAFPSMHGTRGEDGDLMGILEMSNIPYVGCGVQASAIAMDKVTSKQITTENGIKTPPWMWFYDVEFNNSLELLVRKINKLKYPLFVKPAHLGSSIGISKVEKSTDLVKALEVAVHYDNKVVVESAVNNLIEVTLPIIGNKNLTPAFLEQPLLVKDKEFFDFANKYLSSSGKKGGKGAGGGAQGYSKLPADLPKKLYDKAVEVGLNSYKAIGCEGIARVDMLIDSKKEIVYFNEINPLPGSLYAHNWRKSGLSSIDLVEKLLELAESRHKDQNSKNITFSTNFLKQSKI